MSHREIIRRIYKLLQAYRRRLTIAMICMVLVAVLSAVQAYMVKPLLDEIFIKQDEWMLKRLPLALVLLFLVKGVFYFNYSYLLDHVGQSVVMDLRKKIYAHLQDLPLSFFHRMPTGEVISRVISDVTLIQVAVSHALLGVLKDSIQIVGLLGVVFYLNWRLALVSFVFLPLAVIPIISFGRKHRQLSTENQQTTALVSNILFETVGGNRIVKAFCMEDYEIGRFSKMLEKLFEITMKDVKVRSLAHPIMELLGGIGIAVILWFGGWQVIKGTSTPGAFFSFLTALIMVYDPIKGISKLNSSIQQGIAAAVRVFDFLDVQPDITDKPGAPDLIPLQDKVSFRNVSFSYDETEVLRNIDLEVKAGEILAIVGPSGSGKTTLANLIPRFFEVTKGSICIDGHDLRDVTLNSLRGQIAVVTQQTILFNDNVRNNIAYGDPSRSEEEIVAAAKAAYALDFINGLPKGFETVIGESGTKLSGGERQRLSIARALLKNAPILILDEATSALDSESEREVQRALDNLMKNRTTFVIAHRLSTIRNADRIIVLQDGRIVEDGNHEQLLVRAGLYKVLHRMQH